MTIVDWLKTQRVAVSGAGTSHVTLVTRDCDHFAASDQSPAFAICESTLRYLEKYHGLVR
jgi:hypothetical protein